MAIKSGKIEGGKIYLPIFENITLGETENKSKLNQENRPTNQEECKSLPPPSLNHLNSTPSLPKNDPIITLPSPEETKFEKKPKSKVF